MHRHGYQGRKFGRERDQREALLKGLAEALILRGAITTTLPKAKETLRYTEKLITKAKVGDLHNRRQIIAKLSTLEAANKLVDELAPKLAGRNSGHLRIEKLDLRRGDSAQMAKLSFVDKLEGKPEAKPEAKKAAAKKVEGKEEAETKETKQHIESGPKVQAKTAANQAARRTGRRGNR